MKTIWRYEITKDVQDIDMPVGATILKVAVTTKIYPDCSKEVVSLWAEIPDTTSHYETRRFLRFGTGADMSDTVNFNMQYIGTSWYGNQYACHIYEAL